MNVTNVGTEMLGATWGPDDTIVFATLEFGTGLRRVSASGGTPTVLTTPDKARGELLHAWPEFLPGGRALLFTIRTGQREEAFQIAALDLESGTTKILVSGGSSPHFSPTGHIVYAIENTLRAVPFDPVRLEVLGDPVPLVQGVITKSSGGADFSISADGTLVYVAGTGVQRRLVWAERGGSRQPIDAPPRNYAVARISPDGARAALAITDQESDIWIWDFVRQTLTRLTANPGYDGSPAWTPDGRQIVFVSNRSGVAAGGGALLVQSADGTGAAEQLTDANVTVYAPNSFSADARRLVFTALTPSMDLRMLTLDGQRREVPLIQTPFEELNAEISPDGRWLAYQSYESGRAEVYVRPFPAIDTGRWQVSTAGGAHPAWARDGRELFYVAPGGALMAVEVRTRGVAAGVPRTVVDGSFFLIEDGSRSYDISPDGKRFLLIEAANTGTQADTAALTVVLNWSEELTRLVPRK